MTELDSIIEKIVLDVYPIDKDDDYHSEGTFLEGWYPEDVRALMEKAVKAAFKPENMKLTEEVKGLIKTLKQFVECKDLIEKIGTGESWISKRSREALKPFEKEGEE